MINNHEYSNPATLAADTQDSIDKGIWTVVGVPNGDSNFFYTIGLTNLDLPEIIMAGPFEPEQGGRILNHIAEKAVKNKKNLKDIKLYSKVQGFLSDYDMPIIFTDADHGDIKAEWTGQATEFYGRPNAYSLVQAVWPDHFKVFPWEDGCEEGCIITQPQIGKALPFTG